MVILTAVQSDAGWGGALLSGIDAILSITGGISLLLCVLRFFHNRKMVSWTDSAIIKDYDPEYDFEMAEKNPIYAKIARPTEYTALVMFKPQNCVIKKLEIIRLRQNGKVKRIAETYRNLSPETPVFFHVERAECITRYKLKWYLDFGDYCEYELVENGRNGINDSEGAVYHSTWISNLRKAFGFI